MVTLLNVAQFHCAYILIECIGHLWTYVFSGDIVAMAMARRNVGMGPILRFYMGPKPWVIISDPDIVHELLNVHGVSTSHRPKHSYEHGCSLKTMA